MKKMIVAVLAVALLITSGVAMAQGWGRGPGYGPGPGAGYGPGPGMGYGPWAGNLNLTPEQNQKIQALRESHFKDTMSLRNEMQVKQLELRTLWAQANPDQEKILAKQKEINALRTQLQEKATKHRLEIRKVLTPEQQAQLGAYGPGYGRGFGMKGGFGPGRGMGYGGYGVCPRW